MVRIAVKAWSMTVKFPAKISPLTRMSQVLGFWFLVEKRGPQFHQSKEAREAGDIMPMEET